MSKRAKTYLAIAITTVVFIFLMRVWPYQLVKNPSKNAHASVAASDETGYLESRYPVYQLFVTGGEYIDQIEIECNIAKAQKGEAIFAVLLDQEKQVVYEETIPVKKIGKNGKLVLKPKTACEQGRLYTIELYLKGTESLISVKQADIALLGQTEYTEIAQFDVQENYAKGFLASYTYMADCTPVRMAFYYVAAIAAGIACWWIIVYLYNILFAEREKAASITAFCIKNIVTLALFILYGYGVFQATILNVFGGQIYDQIIHGIGMTVLLAFLLYMIWVKKQDQKTVLLEDPEELEDSFYETGMVAERKVVAYHPLRTWNNYLQVVAFGLLLHCCVLYQNAARLYDQKTNVEWAGILLGSVILLQQLEHIVETVVNWKNDSSDVKAHKKQSIFLAVHLVLLVALLVFLVYDAQGYCKANGIDAESMYLAKITCWRTGIWAVIGLNTILFFRPALLKQFSIPMVIFWAFFAIWLWTHQYHYLNLRYIPVYFSVMMLQNWNKETFKKLLYNLMNGMILAFFINMTLSLLYRPYQRWIFYRYPMYFHTVACTGEFLVAAEAAVLAKFLLKVKDGKIRKGITELVILGVVFVYQILSMARTTLTSTAALILVGLIMTKIIYHRTWKQVVTMAGAMLLSVVVLFPTVFSAVRIVPALVDDPYRFPIDMEQKFEYGIEKGDPIDDRDYMVFMRFLYCFMSRYHFPDFIEEWVATQYQEIAFHKVPLQEPVRLADSALLMPSYHFYMLAGITEGSSDDAANNDISNRRFEIWSTYLKDLNMTGHDKIALVGESGDEYIHAHNSFIQMTHSIGIPGGIGFIVLSIVSFVTALLRTLQSAKNKELNNDYLIALLIIVAYGAASLTEWLATMMIPMAMMFWIAIVVLIRSPENNDERKKLRTVQKNI